jgi:hypothetical protein
MFSMAFWFLPFAGMRVLRLIPGTFILNPIIYLFTSLPGAFQTDRACKVHDTMPILAVVVFLPDVQ